MWNSKAKHLRNLLNMSIPRSRNYLTRGTTQEIRALWRYIQYTSICVCFVFAVITVQNFGVQQCYDLKNGHPILFRQQQHNGGAAEQQTACSSVVSPGLRSIF